MRYETQLDVLRLVLHLSRLYSAAMMSLPLTRALDAHRMRARYSTSVRFQQDKKAKLQKQSTKEDLLRKQQAEEAARRASSVTPNEDDKKTKYYTDLVKKRPAYQIRDPKPNDDDPNSSQFFTRYGVRYYPNSQTVTTSTGLPK